MHCKMISSFLLVIQLQVILWVAVVESDGTYLTSPIAMPSCPDHCGEIKIPYPFGIGPKCYYDKSYEILCNTSSNPNKPFLHSLRLEVLDISWNYRRSEGDPMWEQYGRSEEQTITVNMPPLNVCANHGGGLGIPVGSIDLKGTPYNFSAENIFLVEGCQGTVVLMDRLGRVVTGCASECAEGQGANIPFTKSKGECFGSACCQVDDIVTPLGKVISEDEPTTLDFYQVALQHGSSSEEEHSCNMVAALSYRNRTSQLQNKYSVGVPTVLTWWATNLDHGVDNVFCYTPDYDGRLQDCECEGSYFGNPYMPHGCKKSGGNQYCKGGSDGTYYCYRLRPIREILGLSISMGMVFLAIVGYVLYQVTRQKIEKKKKAKYFKRNGGLLLQQQVNSSEGVVERTKVFTINELEKATDNFNKNRILGQGGQGTVYKGMLVDGGIVAVKKSKKVDEGQLEQFINEVVILSHVNHRNVVKLLGCCLETEVPLLVYEFIPNGTLYQYIQDPSEDFQVTWKMRLQIAAESASAIAYLHASSSTPVYHRDIKSANILLDDKYRAKVSDFGTSRAIAIEQTHVTTCVQGTYGYLDPEYFQSNQFTEKSDVYSFGVVLVELITGKKPIHPTESGGWISLASEFISYMETSRLLDILDTRVYEEGKKEEFVAVANLARQCLRRNAKRRPTMKEVARVVDDIRSPNVTDRAGLSCGDDRHVVLNVNEMLGNRCVSAVMSLPDNTIDNCFSFEVVPLVSNTL